MFNWVQRQYRKALSLLHNQKRVRIILCYLLIVLIFFGTFIRPNYTLDTYADVMTNPYDILRNFLQSGRFITAIGFVVFRGLHINVEVVDLLSFVLALIAIVAALYVLEELFRQKLIRQSTWSFVLPLLIILNPFIVELFLYVEKGIMVLGILFCVVAAVYFETYLESRQRSKLALSLLLCILATFCYQGIVGLFIVLATIINLAHFSDWKRFIKDTLLSVIIYAAGPFLNVVFIKVFTSGGRTGGAINIFESIAKIFSGSVDMINLFRIIPSIIYWGLILSVIIIYLAYSIKARQSSTKKTAITLLQIAYLFCVSYLAAIAPQLVQQTSSIWFVARSTYVFASIFGVTLAIIIQRQPKLTTHKLLHCGLLIICVLCLAIQFICFNNIIIDHYNSTEIDRFRAEQLEQIIADYELTHKQEVTAIMPAFDKHRTYFYPGIFASGDINITAFSSDWSDIANINYWTGRRFERIEPSKEWSEHCSQRDWQGFNSEQIKFQDNVLQICWY